MASIGCLNIIVMFPDVPMNFGNLLPRGVFHPPVLSDQVDEFPLDYCPELALAIIDFECGSDSENLSMNLAQPGPVRCFIPESGAETHQLLVDISQKVPARILDTISVSNGQNLLFDNILACPEGVIPS